MPASRASSRTRFAPAASSSTSRSITQSKRRQPGPRRPTASSLSFAASPPKPKQQAKLSFASGPQFEQSYCPKKRVKIEGQPKYGSENEKRASGSQASDEQLWSVLYRPRNRSELAVHSRKVQDVEQWLTDAFTGTPSVKKLRRLLVLTGPAGAAKTETLRQLAAPDELDFEITEYKAEAECGGKPWDDHEDSLGLIGRFSEFISKAARFRSLDFCSSTEDNDASFFDRQIRPSADRRRLVLLEDLPTFSHAPTLAAFQAYVATFLASSIDGNTANVPLCIILSDTASSGSNDWGDAEFVTGLAYKHSDWLKPAKLLGPDCSRMSSWAEIRFNEVSPTILKKALGNALSKVKGQQAKSISSMPEFPRECMEAIAEDAPGDIRSAINLLQQVHHIWTRDPQLFLPVDSCKDKVSGKERARELLLQLGIVDRKSSFVLFHALGKILYNKRSDDGSERQMPPRSEDLAHTVVELPVHLQYLARPRSLVEVEGLVSSSIDPSTLSLYAHQNFPPFCKSIEQCEAICDAHSFADDTFQLQSDERYYSMALSDLYAYFYTSQSTLLHLPYPSQSHHHLTKPAFFDAQARLRSHTSMLQTLKEQPTSLLGPITSVFKPNKELAEELVPMIAKINDLAPQRHADPSGSLTQLLAQLGRFDIAEVSAIQSSEAYSLNSSGLGDESDLMGFQKGYEGDENGSATKRQSRVLSRTELLQLGFSVDQTAQNLPFGCFNEYDDNNNDESDSEDIEDFDDA